MGKINLNNIFYLTNISKILSSQYVISVKTVEILYIVFFRSNSLKSGVCFTHLNSHADFSPEILDLSLNLMKCTVQNIDSQTKLF